MAEREQDPADQSPEPVPRVGPLPSVTSRFQALDTSLEESPTKENKKVTKTEDHSTDESSQTTATGTTPHEEQAAGATGGSDPDKLVEESPRANATGGISKAMENGLGTLVEMFGDKLDLHVMAEIFDEFAQELAPTIDVLLDLTSGDDEAKSLALDKITQQAKTVNEMEYLSTQPEEPQQDWTPANKNSRPRHKVPSSGQGPKAEANPLTNSYQIAMRQGKAGPHTRQVAPGAKAIPNVGFTIEDNWRSAAAATRQAIDTGVNPKPASVNGSIKWAEPTDTEDVRETIKLINDGIKVLILVRGLPGSGKSELARRLVANTATGCIFATDEFFIDRLGNYKWDPSRLQEFHEKNQKRTIQALAARLTPIVVDNTNLELWEMKPYVLTGMQYKYEIRFLEPNTPWRYDVKHLAKSNRHGIVSPEMLALRLSKFDKNVSLERFTNLHKTSTNSTSQDNASSDVQLPEVDGEQSDSENPTSHKTTNGLSIW